MKIKLILFGVLALVTVIVIFQNTDHVPLRFLFWQWTMPRILLLTFVFLSGFALGAVGGVLDTVLFLHLGLDFEVAGRDLTGFVAAYLGVSFALLCAAIGWFIDARARARRATAQRSCRRASTSSCRRSPRCSRASAGCTATAIARTRSSCCAASPTSTASPSFAAIA